MNETPNDPRESFQAGAPMHGDGSIQDGAARGDAEPMPREDANDGEAAAMLDACALAIKGYERWGLVAGVVLQLGVLLSMIFMGGFKVLGGGF